MFDFSTIIGTAADTLETGVRDIDSRLEEIANRIHLTNRLLAAQLLMMADDRWRADEVVGRNIIELAQAIAQGNSYTETAKLDNNQEPER